MAYQSVFIKNIRFLTFNFITTTLLDVLDKNRHQHISYLCLHILALTTEVDCPERC